jgi:hypothetical protein
MVLLKFGHQVYVAMQQILCQLITSSSLEWNVKLVGSCVAQWVLSGKNDTTNYTWNSERPRSIQSQLLGWVSCFSFMLIGYLLIFIYVERIHENDILSLAFKLELFLLMSKHRYQLSRKKSIWSEMVTASTVCLLDVLSCNFLAPSSVGRYCNVNDGLLNYFHRK